jgi:NADH-quinone oxidoreductase subunit J
MTAYDILFWVFSLALLASGVGVILSSNPVSSAMCLILVFLFLAGLFVLLGAYFLAIIQVLVYAGAVMVLFLFVVMMLDVKEPRRWWWHNRLGLLGGAGVAGGLLFAVTRVLSGAAWPLARHPVLLHTDLRAVLTELFSHYALPFLVTALLLLAATVGVVLLGGRQPD